MKADVEAFTGFAGLASFVLHRCQCFAVQILHDTQLTLVVGSEFSVQSETQRPGVLILTIEVYIGSLSQFALVGADSQKSLGFAIPRHVLGITQKIGLSILSSKKKIRQK